MSRTFFHANAAIRAFAIVNDGQIALDMNRVERTIFFAKTAGNAADRTTLAHQLALFCRLTVYMNNLILRDQTHHMLRTNGHTLAAGHAIINVDFWQLLSLDRKSVV